ncbi:Tad domain-containing protein [Desulfococcus multivorans]|uniref:Putative Flp pilus-assembly TadG-like N-terminal domain-containing protein n=1 Tax=Desulfococcus multivorans DSM 2059 TaxID=1121405 RepID=S7TDD6_DESML|nr:Tad domain-containing protein [Desulfococcus multivorans]EPR35192.1 Protein of unknown function DUF2134, membrane [Desulfococcus multivorans DSM 2059]SJZ49730.1 Putative Flp pilus-assembly TadE/G-like [Desulfococcus multivorans DSM 2059]
MDEKKNKMDALRNNKGVTAVFVLFMLAGLIGVTVLAIDVGYIKTTRNELQNIADAGALAGAGHLGSIYLNYPVSDQSTHTFSLEEVTAVAAAVKDVAKKNRAGNEDSIAILDSDIIIGKWDSESKQVNPTLGYPNDPPDAVQVTARRSKAANSQLTTFFVKAFNAISTFTNNLSKNLGINSSDINMMDDPIDVSAHATAALTGPNKVAEGALTLPIGISEILFKEKCDDIDTIDFSPTQDSCAGWHNFFDGVNGNLLYDKMLGLIEGHEDCDICEEKNLTLGHDWLLENHEEYYTSPPFKSVTPEVSPELSVGDTLNYTGGDLGKLIPKKNSSAHLDSTYDGNEGGIIPNGVGKAPAPFPNLFDYFRYRDGDGDDSVWTTAIPVYEEEGECSNPKYGKILGFATIIVKGSEGPPITNVEANVLCKLSVIEGRGGGGTYGGLKGSIPNLVE